MSWRARNDDVRRRRAAMLGMVVAAATLLPACDGGNVSVGVGVAVPAPWGGVAIGGAVPIGPYPGGGRYGPMW